MTPGTRVKMSEALKDGLMANGCEEHVDEFGDCVGIVVGLCDYNNCDPDDPDWDRGKVGPEFDVRWKPSNLRYGYHPEHLIVVD